ncbi:paralemmin-3 [Ochotona curzoniae]|uniref:paralemmin-3 n=1 Tax=Ochotona curzoniae TaxID=130825 RepID=UPI001B34B689|nr:paralemmin-3 [Ochotona curzoniae]
MTLQSQLWSPAMCVPMAESSLYRQRLEVIAEKRRLQEQISTARRELDEERLRVERLKRKSVRERWLMDGTATQDPAPQDPQSPEGQAQARIQTLEDSLFTLHSQLQLLQSASTGAQHKPWGRPTWRRQGPRPLSQPAMEMETGLAGQATADRRASLPLEPLASPQAVVAEPREEATEVQPAPTQVPEANGPCQAASLAPETEPSPARAGVVRVVWEGLRATEDSATEATGAELEAQVEQVVREAVAERREPRSPEPPAWVRQDQGAVEVVWEGVGGEGSGAAPQAGAPRGGSVGEDGSFIWVDRVTLSEDWEELLMEGLEGPGGGGAGEAWEEERRRAGAGPEGTPLHPEEPALGGGGAGEAWEEERRRAGAGPEGTPLHPEEPALGGGTGEAWEAGTPLHPEEPALGGGTGEAWEAGTPLHPEEPALGGGGAGEAWEAGTPLHPEEPALGGGRAGWGGSEATPSEEEPRGGAGPRGGAEPLEAGSIEGAGQLEEEPIVGAGPLEKELGGGAEQLEEEPGGRAEPLGEEPGREEELKGAESHEEAEQLGAGTTGGEGPLGEETGGEDKGGEEGPRGGAEPPGEETGRGAGPPREEPAGEGAGLGEETLAEEGKGSEEGLQGLGEEAPQGAAADLKDSRGGSPPQAEEVSKAEPPLQVQPPEEQEKQKEQVEPQEEQEEQAARQTGRLAQAAPEQPSERQPLLQQERPGAHPVPTYAPARQPEPPAPREGQGAAGPKQKTCQCCAVM